MLVLRTGDTAAINRTMWFLGPQNCFVGKIWKCLHLGYSGEPRMLEIPEHWDIH